MRLLIVGALVAIAYIAAAVAGFHVAFVAEQVTTVWAPTGIAMAALILWGVRLWPAVWIGAFIANATTDAPLWTAALIASGNTLEAVSLAWLLPRTRFDPSLLRFADAARLIVWGAFLAPAISATIGVTTLGAAGVQPWSRFIDLWSAWWLGDALGALVVAPLILTVVRSMRERSPRVWLNYAALVLVSAGVTQVAFGEVLGAPFGTGPLHYVLFPLVILSAVRFGQPSTALVVFSASAVTIFNTVRGVGPFATPDVSQGLVLLQAFMGVLASTGLLLAAAVTEGLATQRRLSAAHAVGEVLARAPDLEEAAPALLRCICDHLDWQFGAIWLIGDDQRLRCAATWGVNAALLLPFKQRTETMAFERGSGLPGRVWESGRATWVEDVVLDANFPRRPAAIESGLHGALGFPIRIGAEVIGMIEVFTSRVVAPNTDLLEAMSTIGTQVGQFIARKRGEESIRRSQEQLRDADRRKDEFLAMLAHELRNPLAPIRTGLEVVRLAGDDPRTVEQIRPMMERQITHMVRLIDDLLDVSRITSGKIHLQREHAPLSALINAAVDANRTAVESSRAQLVVDVPPEAIHVDVDPTRFVQVLSNLLHNAAKFTGPNGRIEIRARIDDRADDRELEVSVSDTGIGIPPELLPRVFDLFTQGDRPIHRGSEGLGIGLSLARRIVDLHGGRIEARSDGAGTGSTFVIRLPFSMGLEAPAPAIVTPAGDLTDRRVLVIDDNDDGAEMLARVVQALGGLARTANDGASGIRAVEEFEPDVILLDIGMHGMDGYEACRRIRQHDAGKRAFIVAVTGWGQERDKQLASDAGFDAHLTKPADPDALQRLLAGR